MAVRLAAVFWLLAGGAASAAPATALSNVNLRSAPGTDSAVVARIPAGARVEVGRCAEWCDVTWQDKKGFAIATALDRSGATPGGRTAKTRDPYRTEIADKGEVPMSLGPYVAPERHYGPYFWSYGPPSGQFKGTSGIGYRGRW